MDNKELVEAFRPYVHTLDADEFEVFDNNAEHCAAIARSFAAEKLRELIDVMRTRMMATTCVSDATSLIAELEGKSQS